MWDLSGVTRNLICQNLTTTGATLSAHNPDSLRMTRMMYTGIARCARRLRKQQTYDLSSTSTDHSDAEDRTRHRRRNEKPNHEKTPKPVDLSMYNEDSVAYLLGSYDDTAETQIEARDTVADTLQKIPDKEHNYRRPPVYGDSLFTQEEGEKKYRPNQNSLVEFEQLEAAMSEGGSDHMDLIGTYLQSLTDQDELDDEDQDFRDSLHYLDRGQRSGENQDLEISDQEEDSSGVPDEFLLVPQVPQLQQDESHDQQSLPGSADSIPFNDSQASASLITEVQPPFTDSLVMTSLDLTSSFQQGGSVRNSRDLQTRSTSPRRSRIPVSSRPGSACASPTRSRPASRADSPVKNIPACKQSAGSPSRGSHHHLNESPQTAYNARATDGGRMSAQNRTSPNKDIDKAASMLLGDDDLDSELQEGLPPEEGLTPSTTLRGPSPSRSPIKRSQSAGPVHSTTLRNKLSTGTRRSLTPQSFRVRGRASPQTPQRNKPQPLKATPELAEIKSTASFDGSEDLSQSSQTKTELKARVVSELNARKQNEDELSTLRKEYNSLLIKHAEVENMVDMLRMGAKVNLYANAPTPGAAQAGKVPQAQQARSFTIPRGSVASVGTLGQTPQTASVHGSRPASRNSQTNGWPGALMSTVGVGDESAAEATNSITEDGIKLSLMAKAKGVQEQANAFEILLSEDHLTLEDQEKALHNVKQKCEDLQQEYRDAKQDHEFRRRQGLLSAGSTDAIFDENKEVEGDLHKLNMKLDDLEHRVQENTKGKTVRKPFSGSPMKADHDLGVGSLSASEADGGQPIRQLSPRRPPSVGSHVGSPGEIDEKLHQLNKEYNCLMDRYRKLKQLRRTPERDEEVNDLLTKLRDVYEQTPDHRKPALPTELESQYNAVDGHFVEPDDFDQSITETDSSPMVTPRQERQSRSDRDHHHRKGRSRDSLTTGDSDLSTTPERGPRRGRYDNDPHSSSTMRDTSQESADRRRHGLRDGRHSSSDSYDRRSGGSSERRPRKLPSHGPGKRHFRPFEPDKASKDSGYVGSESSRKALSSGKTNHQQSLRSGLRPSGKTSKVASGDEDLSDNSSTDSQSTVEERIRPYKPGTKTGSTGTSQEKKASRSGQGQDPRVAGTSSSTRGRHGTDSYTRGRHTEQGVDPTAESEEVSLISGGATKKASKGDQIQSLQNDVTQLKQHIGIAGTRQVAAPQQQQLQQQPHLQQQVPPHSILRPQPVQTLQIPHAPMGNQHQLPNAPMGSQTAYYPSQQQPANYQVPHQGHYGMATNAPPTTAVHYGRPAAKEILRPSQGHSSGAYYDRRDAAPYRSRTPPRDFFRIGRDRSYRHSPDPYDDYDRDRDTGHRYRDLDHEPRRLSDLSSDPEYDTRKEQSRQRRRRRDAYDDDNCRFDRDRDRDRDRDSADYDTDYLDRGYDHDATEPKHHSRHHRDAYYSDPESPERDHRRRSKNYYLPHRARDEYEAEYGRDPLDHDTFASRYLTQSGAQGGDGYSGAGYTAPQGYPQGVSGGYGDASDIFNPAGGVTGAYGTQHQGVQNVPQMSSQGVQYMPPGHGVAAPPPPAYPGYGVGTGTGVSATPYGGYYSTQGPVTTGVPTAGTAPIANGVAPAQGYQAVAAGCSICGAQGYHTHGEYVYQQPAAAQVAAVTPGVAGSTSATYVVPSAGTGTGVVVAAPGQGQTYVPVQVVPASQVQVQGSPNNRSLNSSRVRYYIREYGDTDSGSSYSDRSRRGSRRRYETDEYSDDDEVDDLNNSLESAMKTASQLKKMSRSMKQTLHSELSRSYKSSSSIMASY